MILSKTRFKNFFFNIFTHFADKKADQVFNYNNKQIKYSKKIVEVTKEESSAHSIFLKEKLKKNFFN